MFYLFLAYSTIWAAIAAYIAILGRRQKELKKELNELKQWCSEDYFQVR